MNIRMIRILGLILLILSGVTGYNQSTVKIALLKYSGGGDWYSNPTSLPNLIQFCNEELGTDIDPEPGTVDVGSPEIFSYAWVHMTGHGNVVFSQQDINNLRDYLKGGGFLHISDNYGINEFIRREMKRVFPDSDFVELPFDFPIYHQTFEFNKGLPKIHEHDGGEPQGFGIFVEGRLVCFYDYECDLGDGWEDIEVHKDSQTTRLKALQMGANIIQFAFTQ